MKNRLLAVSAFFCLLATAPLASAATINIAGGETVVKFDVLNLLDSLGIELSLLGSATIDGGRVTFDITGGVIDTMNGMSVFQHDGSGLQLSSGANELRLENFVIDKDADQLFADATVNGTSAGSIALFNVDWINRLKLTLEGSEALAAVFGVDIAAGTRIGAADVRPTAVPIPGAVWLMLGGLGAMSRLRKSL